MRKREDGIGTEKMLVGSRAELRRGRGLDDDVVLGGETEAGLDDGIDAAEGGDEEDDDEEGEERAHSDHPQQVAGDQHGGGADAEIDQRGDDAAGRRGSVPARHASSAPRHCTYRM